MHQYLKFYYCYYYYYSVLMCFLSPVLCLYFVSCLYVVFVLNVIASICIVVCL
jgi:hypothetical protein